MFSDNGRLDVMWHVAEIQLWRGCWKPFSTGYEYGNVRNDREMNNNTIAFLLANTVNIKFINFSRYIIQQNIQTNVWNCGSEILLNVSMKKHQCWNINEWGLNCFDTTEICLELTVPSTWNYFRLQSYVFINFVSYKWWINQYTSDNSLIWNY